MSESIYEEVKIFYQRREEIIRISRNVVRLSSYTTVSTLKYDRNAAKEHLSEISKYMDQLNKLLLENPQLYEIKSIAITQQEFTEAKCLYAFIFMEELPSDKTLNVSTRNYLLGLIDAALEMRREIVQNLRDEDIEKAERHLLGIRTVYDFCSQFMAEMKYISKNFRPKMDAFRIVLERTEGDVLRSSETRKVYEKIKEIVGKRCCHKE